MELAVWIVFDIFTEKLIIVRQLASSALFAAAIGAGIVPWDWNNQDSKEIVFFINIYELIVEINFPLESLLCDSIEISDDLIIDLLVWKSWIHEKQVIRCNILTIHLSRIIFIIHNVRNHNLDVSCRIFELVQLPYV